MNSSKKIKKIQQNEEIRSLMIIPFKENPSDVLPSPLSVLLIHMYAYMYVQM